MTLEVRKFDGDAATLSDFVVGGWRTMYQSSGFVPIWTADYFRWQLPSLAAGRTDEIVAAYDGERLVGVYPAEVVPARLRGNPMTVTMSSWLTVDPALLRKGIGRALLNEVRHFNQKVGGVYNVGLINQGAIAGKGRSFWAASPAPVTMFKQPRMWVRVLDWRTLSRAMWSRNDRASVILTGAIIGSRIPVVNELVRAYQPTDLDSCHTLFQEHMRGFDFEYFWDRDRLAHHLGFGNPSRTLVLDSPSGVEGYVNFHILDAIGRSPFRIGIIDGLAPERLAPNKAADLLNAVLAAMRDAAVALVTLLGPPIHRRSVLLKCGFLPPPSTYKLIFIEMQPGTSLAGLQRIYTHIR
jgi:GNAT superfamily N-acetyltransferase